MTRSKVESFAWKVVTSFSYRASYGFSTNSIVVPICDPQLDAIAFKPRLSSPLRAATVSFAGFPPVLLPLQAAAKAMTNAPSSTSDLFLIRDPPRARSEPRRLPRSRQVLALPPPSISRGLDTAHLGWL